MKKSNEFENILDDCLERLARGETVEQCLESYPEQAAQLRPLLQTSQLAREASAILPRAEFIGSPTTQKRVFSQFILGDNCLI